MVLSLFLSFHVFNLNSYRLPTPPTLANLTDNQTFKTPAGKEEERAMFQQMQAMAQKQVNIEQYYEAFVCLILI